MKPKKTFILAITLITLLTSSITYATLAPLTPPPLGGYDSGSNSILDPGCAPNAVDCFVNLPSSGSGWSLTGNAGTIAGTNFIGTTDAQDFMVKTNGNQIALFGQNGKISLGSNDIAEGFPFPVNSGTHSFAFGSGSQSTGYGSIAIGSMDPSYALLGTRATGNSSVAIGLNALAQGEASAAIGNQAEALAKYSFAIGNIVSAHSISETALGMYNSSYVPVDTYDFNRLFSIGNGGSLTNHNAYTLFKDGSFAYNDDNFQNDTPGTEQNMFYFNYGNHDGNGDPNSKRAIRLGSAFNDEWDINSTNVGDRSIAIGFGSAIASGDYSVSLGFESEATGIGSIAWGEKSKASGAIATAWGDSRASGQTSTAWGNASEASGDGSTAFGTSVNAYSYTETAIGTGNTAYTPNSISGFIGSDRLFVVGNNDGITGTSDALTILKSGQTGIAIDNFEANTNGNIFQVGDGTTGIIGYVDNGTGNWVAVSDERKKDNITDLTYGLNELMKLRPTSFNYKRNNEHTIGFLAQQVLPIIPEAVYGTESEGYGMSYATLTPVIVKAIQELNLKVDLISMNAGNASSSIFDSLKNWLGDASNGITDFFAQRGHFKELCIGENGNETCLTKDQVDQLLNQQAVSVPIVPTPDLDITDPTTNTETIPEPVLDTGSQPETPTGNPTSDPVITE